MASNIFEKVLENVDIVDVVSTFVELEPKGKNLFGLCPFHDDNNPSMSVSREKGIFYCFVCKKGGNALKFVEEYKHIEPIEAAKFLANQYHIDISEFEYQSSKPSTKRYYDCLNTASKFYQYLMKNEDYSKEAREYLHNRGISDDVIKEFEIGLSPKDSDGLKRTLIAKGILESDLAITGLINGDKDTFINRIMIPIKDELDRVVAFGGRIYTKDSTQAKYINTKETQVFKKGELIFNLERASKDKTRDFLIINEGYMDVIQSASNGINNAVALMGTSLTDEQVALLKKYTNKVVICLDGDMPGVEATKSLIRQFEKERIEYSIVMLEENLDPDEYLRKYGKDKYLDLILNKRVDKMGYFYELTKRQFGSITSFNIDNFKNEIFRNIKDSKSKTLIESYLRRLSQDLKVSFESLSQDFNTYIGKSSSKPFMKGKDKENNTFKVKSMARNAEELVIAYSIESKEYYDLIIREMKDYLFIKSKDLRSEFIAIGDIYSKVDVTKEELVEQLKLKNYVIYDFKTESHNPSDLKNNVLKVFRISEIDEEISEIQDKLNDNSRKDIDRDELVKRNIELIGMRKKLGGK